MFFKALFRTILTMFLLTFAVLCIVFQNDVSEAICDAFMRCITKIIPSLFSMSVISSVMLKADVFGRLFGSKIDSRSLNTFIFGNIGGYPIGAKLCAEAKTDNQFFDKSSLLICSSFSCGPAFAVSVSYMLYNNAIFGIISFISIFISNLVLYIVYILNNKGNNIIKTDSHMPFSTPVVVDCVINSAYSMINITAMICAFSLITSVLKCIFPIMFISFIPAVFEISYIAKLNYPSLYILTALLAFGGLCVHTQIISIASSKFSLKQFYLSRIIQIPLATVISYIIDRIFSISKSISVSSNSIRLSESNSIIPFICVIFMLIIAINTKIKQRMN